MPHVFVSYVRENAAEIDRLAEALRAARVDVWLDRERIRPGARWRTVIRSAIQEGAFFLACFSGESAERARTFMNEELTFAIDELRRRPVERSWFLPVILRGGEVPDRPIGGGETLRDLQHVDLTTDWNAGIATLLNTVACTHEPLAEARATTDELELNANCTVEVVELTTNDAEEQIANPEPFVIAKRLSNFGFNVRMGGWDAARLLARLAPEQANSAYIVHRNDPALARRLVHALARLEVAPRIVVLTTDEVAAASAELEERRIIEQVDALVVYRNTA